MPEVEVEAGETLIVSGPASIRLLAGEAQILAAPLSLEDRVTIRRWRRLPIYCSKPSRVEVGLGSGGSINKVRGSTIPAEWWEASNRIIEALEKTQLVAVVGGVDVGKTTFTVFLCNRALTSGLKVSVVDGDLGQSDIGPPCTVGSALLSRPVFDLFFVKPERLVFVGSVTPAKVKGRLLEALKELCGFERGRASLVVLNTDGWISGDGAESFKVELVRSVEADWVVALQSAGELESILKGLEGLEGRVLRVPSSPAVRPRSRGERRELRWQAYNKYLAGASILNLKLERLKISGGQPSPGCILGLYSLKPRRLLGIGVALACDQRRGTLKVLTSAKGSIGEIMVGEALPDFTVKPRPELSQRP